MSSRVTWWSVMTVVVTMAALCCATAGRAADDVKSAVSARALYYDDGKPSVSPEQKPPPGSVAPGKPSTKSASALALRVAVKIIDESGGSKEVKPSTVFRSGDRIRLTFNSNKEGYLYLATIGSSGKIDVIVPGPSPRLVVLRPAYTYEFPLPTKVLKFDSQVGEEQLYAFLSESPLDVIDFGNGQQVQINPNKPASEPKMIASTQSVRSRDLVIEEDSQALYAAVIVPVNRIDKPPIVVKLTLTHRDVR